jgi:hypothetical protein
MLLSKSQLKHTLEILPKHIKQDGQIYYTGLAKELNITPSSARARIQTMLKNKVLNNNYSVNESKVDKPSNFEYESPNILDPDVSAEELIKRLKKSFVRKHEAAMSREWMKFKIKQPGPYGLCFVGDPHVDDPGCNWPLLERDIKLITDTDALYGVALGDYTNNWAGRLQRLYTKQETTVSQAWRLAEWFFGQKKANGQSIWMLLIKGNHDAWSGSSDPLDWMSRGSSVLSDWQAKFIVEAHNGYELNIHAAHDFAGSSIYNPLHGPMKKAKFDGRAKIYVCGDKHNWACMELEDMMVPGDVYWACRARGYKFLDDYAEKLGYSGQMYGASVTLIVDPDKEGPAAYRCFPDLEEAVEFLNWKRRKFK